MKHDLYKLANQRHLNANEQQLLQAVLETAKTAVSAACESLQRRIILSRRPIRLSKRWAILATPI